MNIFCSFSHWKSSGILFYIHVSQITWTKQTHMHFLDITYTWVLPFEILNLLTNISWFTVHFVEPYLSDVKLVAEHTTSSWFCTRMGIFLQPGDLRIRCSILRVSWRTLLGHMSIFVTTTNTGTLRASASPKCSFVIPITPALAPIYKQGSIV